MAIGMTNVGGGGNFSATIHCTSAKTNTTVTAVCGTKSYSATSNSSGVADIVVRKPGTYTVSTSERGSKSIVCADKGTTYNCPFMFVLYDSGIEETTYTGGMTVYGQASKQSAYIYNNSGGSGSESSEYTTNYFKTKSVSGHTWTNLVAELEDVHVENGLGIGYCGCAVVNAIFNGPWTRGGIIAYKIINNEFTGNVSIQDKTITVPLATLDANTNYRVAVYNNSYGTNPSAAKVKRIYLI